MNEITRATITLMEAAEWCGKEHAKLLRDIRKYTEQLAEAKIGLGDFFKESTYQDMNNQTRPCYLVYKERLRIYRPQDGWTEGNRVYGSLY